MFNGLKDEEEISPKGHEPQFYCIKKYIDGKNLRNYKIEFNPRKIDTLGLDATCPSVIATARQDAASIFASDRSLKKEQKECVKKKFLANHEYFDAIALAITLGSADVTQNQIKEERNKFITTMNQMTAECNECVLKKEEKKDEKKEEKKAS
jgi:hypothetical protein